MAFSANTITIKPMNGRELPVFTRINGVSSSAAPT